MSRGVSEGEGVSQSGKYFGKETSWGKVQQVYVLGYKEDTISKWGVYGHRIKGQITWGPIDYVGN